MIKNSKCWKLKGNKMKIQNEICRNEQLYNSFLNPSLSNLGEFEKQIKKIIELIREQLTLSNIRIERTERKQYDEVVGNSFIPDKYNTDDEIIEKLGFYFQGLVKWNSPGVMINVNPPSMLLPIAANACCSLFNPNLAMDVPAGNLAYAELEVIKMLSDLVGWDYKKTGGLFTFGGKGTVLYAIRIGLNECVKNAKYDGLRNEKIKVFSTSQGHPCHYENCEWLGIGKNNCIRLPLTDEGTIDMEIAEEQMEKAIIDGNKIACIIVNGGSTLYTTIDQIDKMIDLRDRLVKKYNLPYVPHVHVDSVIGWAWLMFKEYDFQKNPLGFSDMARKELNYVYNAIRNIEKADSFGADFHKTGFTPYLSSVFIIKDKRKLFELGEEEQADLHELEFGLYAPFGYSLESSRAATSALSAWISLKQLGKEGYQKLIGTLVEAGCDMRNYFENAPYSRCANITAHGFAALAMLYPCELQEKKWRALNEFTEEELLSIAEYNHKFYLYMLDLQSKNKIDFALDYVSKHTTVGNIKIGVIKLYPMSPFCNSQFLSRFYIKFEDLLSKFNEIYDRLKLSDSPYRPKPFVTR